MITGLARRIICDCAFVREIQLPRTINAITLPNDDGTFDIYVNSVLPPCKQMEALRHELNHIECNHFYNDIDEIQVIEAEAELAMVISM